MFSTPKHCKSELQPSLNELGALVSYKNLQVVCQLFARFGANRFDAHALHSITRCNMLL